MCRLYSQRRDPESRVFFLIIFFFFFRFYDFYRPPAASIAIYLFPFSVSSSSSSSSSSLFSSSFYHHFPSGTDTQFLVSCFFFFFYSFRVCFFLLGMRECCCLPLWLIYSSRVSFSSFLFVVVADEDEDETTGFVNEFKWLLAPWGRSLASHFSWLRVRRKKGTQKFPPRVLKEKWGGGSSAQMSQHQSRKNESRCVFLNLFSFCCVGQIFFFPTQSGDCV